MLAASLAVAKGLRVVRGLKAHSYLNLNYIILEGVIYYFREREREREREL